MFAGSIEPAEVPAPKKPPQTDEILEEPTTGGGAQLARIQLKKRAKPPPLPPPVPPPPPPAGTFSTIPGAPPTQPDLPSVPPRPFEETGAAHLIPIETEEQQELEDELTIEDDDDEQETEAYDPLDMHGDTRQMDSPPWMDPAMEGTGPDLPRRVPGPPIDMSYFAKDQQPAPEPIVPEAPEFSTAAATRPWEPSEIPTLPEAPNPVAQAAWAHEQLDASDLSAEVPAPPAPSDLLSASQRMAALDQAIAEAIDTEDTEAYAPKPPGLTADPETLPTVPSGPAPLRGGPLIPPPLVQAPPLRELPSMPPPPKAPLREVPSMPPPPAQARGPLIPPPPAQAPPLREVPYMPPAPPKTPLREVPSMPPAPQTPLRGIPSMPPPPAPGSPDAPLSLTDSGIMVVVPDMPVEEVGAGEQPTPGAKPVAPAPTPALIDELAPISTPSRRSAAGHGSALRDAKPTGFSWMTIAVIAGVCGAIVLVVAILLLVKYLR